MGQQKRRGPPPKQPTVGQLKADLAALRTRVDDLRTTVNKHKDILQVGDNWHSRTAKMIGKRVELVLDIDAGAVTGKLLWTDRYTIGIENDAGEEVLVNKGHVVTTKKI